MEFITFLKKSVITLHFVLTDSGSRDGGKVDQREQGLLFPGVKSHRVKH